MLMLINRMTEASHLVGHTNIIKLGNKNLNHKDIVR